jgi:hypothetical protein
MRSLSIACLLLVWAGGAVADPLYPAALTFETGYAFGPMPGFPWLAYSSYGAPLTWVGRVGDVGPPFDDLLPLGAYELTYSFDGSTCTEVGNWDSFTCSSGEYGVFRGGTFTLYIDSTPDADFANLTTFRDGDAVLIALTTATYVTDDDPHESCPWRSDEPDLSSFFLFVGGLWFDRVSSHGDGLEGICNGELEGSVPSELQSLGYVFPADGIVDVYGPVPVASTTWGRVKALYR